jgi:putative transposase
LVARNGHPPERELVTGIGPLKVRQPRVDDRALNQDQRFSSQILPRHLRRVPSVDNLIPILYLKGVSTGDMSEALASILGSGAAGLSPSNVVRLKTLWKQD